MRYETIDGIVFTGHARDRMKSRDIPLRAALLALRLWLRLREYKADCDATGQTKAVTREARACWLS